MMLPAKQMCPWQRCHESLTAIQMLNRLRAKRFWKSLSALTIDQMQLPAAWLVRKPPLSALSFPTWPTCSFQVWRGGLTMLLPCTNTTSFWPIRMRITKRKSRFSTPYWRNKSMVWSLWGTSWRMRFAPSFHAAKHRLFWPGQLILTNR